MRIRSLVLGTLAGGLAALVWSNVSWDVIGWHEKAMRGFQKDAEVGAVISSHTLEDGTYLLPYGTSPEAMERYRTGPVMVASVRRGGFRSFGQAIAVEAASLFVAAGLLTWLLLQTSGLSYWRRVLFVGVVGLAASVIVDVPNWNWWGFSSAFTAVDLADNVVTWVLAGLVIARVAPAGSGLLPTRAGRSACATVSSGTAVGGLPGSLTR